MKFGIVIAAIFAFNATQAMAVCSNPLSQGQLQSALTNNYACDAAKTWNELHSAGNITDYKKGPTDPIDPTTVVGVYAVSNSTGTGVVTYTYTGDPTPYSFTVQSLGSGTYLFCHVSPAGSDITITIQANHC